MVIIYAQDIYGAGEKVKTSYGIANPSCHGPREASYLDMTGLIQFIRGNSFDWKMWENNKGENLKIAHQGGDSARVIIERALNPSELETIAKGLSEVIE